MVLRPGLYWPWVSSLGHVRDRLWILFVVALASRRLILNKVLSLVSASSSLTAEWCGNLFLISVIVASGARSATSSARMPSMDEMKHANAMSSAVGGSAHSALL